MERVEIIPGVVVDEEMHEHATQGLAEHAPGENVPWETFADGTSWLLVPGPDGAGYKAELVVRREEHHTIKFNLWMSPDLRAGAGPRPHNHPWEFTAFVLMGGYTEERYQVVDGVVRAWTQIHEAGGRNHLALNVFHEVTEIHAPARTLTLMLCGQGRERDWGYLDIATGAFEANQADPAFETRLQALNPRARRGRPS
ncbi:hypothetical protein [Streptomyces sp. NBC_01304]|uniref:hypothetical protein n=1 Tax=Streptomyces sp. NBC_01304 TaxID=2903818 RepID=UPI002E0F7084|nr:hypothetical protein OG430_33235 [Streptomyces sp. NBC_01304]